jgi:hypothetical protein
VVWDSIVVRVERFEYSSHDEAISKFTCLFGWFEPEPYFEASPDSGFALVYKAQPMRLLNVVRPPSVQLLPQGWRALDSDPVCSTCS